MATTAEGFVDMLIDDAELRQAFQRNPDGIIERLDVQLDEDQRQGIVSYDWNQPDEELRARISKFICCSRSDRRLKTRIAGL